MAAQAKSAKSKPRTKSEIYQEVSSATGLTRKQVGAVFDEVTKLIHSQLGSQGPGVFTFPGLLKIKRVVKPATQTRTIPNPFKPGEMITVQGKPARNAVRALALKNLKQMVK